MPTVAYGVNHETLTSAKQGGIISFAPMETQVLANTLKPLNKEFTVNSAIAKSYRSYANSQPTVDSYDSKSFARGRAAAWLGDNFAKCIGLTFPELNGKVIGMSYRAPILNGSVLDITAVVEKEATVSQLNACFKSNSRYYGCNEEPLCSSDATEYEKPQYLAKTTMTTKLYDDSYMVSLSVIYDNVRGYCMMPYRYIEWMIG